MRDRLQRLAETGTTGERQLVTITLELERLLAREHLPNDVHVLARAREPLRVVVAVPAFRDLRTGRAQSEHETPTRKVVHRQRGHRHRRRRACRELTDRRAELDLL